MHKLFLLLLLIITGHPLSAQDIKLPAADREGGKPLMQALNNRKSDRSFQGKELTPQQLSNLLWAANGFNREDKRTVPTANNRQELELYVTLKSGIYFYDAGNHLLRMVKKGDYRKSTGMQDFVGLVPLNVIFVSDQEKASSEHYAYTSCGYVSQNIYLYCASEGLGTVVRGSFDKDQLAGLLQLPPHQQVLLTQSVGYVK
ncbi:MAG: SagB/ThcOx family dehydrogenase [Proteiniphilum sp.]|jgi:SagB-type dehydrogenase family enzyme|nr:SagB/ThcOx family dehydrogenase [Proteiniphilum sp.]